MKITIQNLEVSSEYNAKIFLKKEQEGKQQRIIQFRAKMDEMLANIRIHTINQIKFAGKSK